MEEKIKKVLLKELGPVMPLGIKNPDGAYSKTFTIKPWRMKEERELGQLRDQNRGSTVASFVSSVLTTMCTNIGFNTIEKMKSAEKMVMISQMFIGDVYYLYTWLRISSLGGKLNMNITCPNCSNRFKFIADLETIEVNTCDSLDDACWDYKLKKPFQIRNKDVNELRMGPPRWSTLENMEGIGALNTGEAKANLILGSIVGIKNWKTPTGEMTPVVLTMAELDEMCKEDIEALTGEMDEHSIGPDMSVEGNCPKCRSNYVDQIDWSYDNFFGASSR